jgi:hypothetical protein
LLRLLNGRIPSHTRTRLLHKAAFSGIPVAMAGRGAPMGFADPTDFHIAASNLTANKAPLPADGLPVEARRAPDLALANPLCCHCG